MQGIPQVIIAGHGQMGHAMETLLQERTTLSIWDIAPERLQPPTAITAAAARCDFLLVCVPTAAHAAVLGPLAPLLPAGAGVMSIAKGLDDDGRTAADILADRFAGKASWGVLGGPMIANEIRARRPAFAQLGTDEAALYGGATALFQGSGLRLSHAPEPRAVSWCGVLKNAYAPLIGISDMLGWGDNARGYLVMAALLEMQQLIKVFTHAPVTAYAEAGLADFVTTVTSKSSHHYALGQAVARGELPAPGSEGVHSLTVLKRREMVEFAAYPLLKVAAGLVDDPLHVPVALDGWLRASL